MKSEKTAWMMWAFGLHFAYLGMMRRQVLYTVTLGGLGIWSAVEALKLEDRVAAYNAAVT